MREAHLLFAISVEVSENWNGFTLSKRSLGPTRSCITFSLGAQADVARPLQTFGVPFGKDLLEWDVAFNETFARWLLSLLVLLCDEENTGNGKDQEWRKVVELQGVTSGFGSAPTNSIRPSWRACICC